MPNANQTLPTGAVLRGTVYTYTIEKVLGLGTFGITYLASTSMKGPLGEVTVQVAVKEFFAKDLDSRGEGGTVTARTEDGVAYRYAKAFQRESQNLSKMKHPGIVKVLEAFQANGTYYYAMEYLSGGSLDDKVKGVGMPEEEALPLIGKIGEALSYMHSRKMMHLDLKPKNIMLKADGTPVIIDFGLSKQYDDQGEPESSTSIGLGTPGYAPIEQANQEAGGAFQPSIDIYALGATLYKMLIGSTPPTASAVLNQKDRLDMALKEKGVSSGVAAAIVAMMSPAVDDRPADVKTVLSMLSGNSLASSGNNANDETEKKSKPKSPHVLQPNKPKPWLKALLGCIVLVALIVALLGRGGRQRGDIILPADSSLVVTGGQSITAAPVEETPDTPSDTTPIPESPGSIKVSSEPAGATIWLDGKDMKKQTPDILEDIAPGKHSYKLVLEGYTDDNGSITVSSGRRANVSRTLKALPQERPTPVREPTRATEPTRIQDNHNEYEPGETSAAIPKHIQVNVFFASDASVINESESSKLIRLANVMMANPNVEIAIAGYCDKSSIDNKNEQQRLAEERAIAVKSFLVNHGIAESRIVSVVAMGDRVMPFAENELNNCAIITSQ